MRVPQRADGGGPHVASRRALRIVKEIPRASKGKRSQAFASVRPCLRAGDSRAPGAEILYSYHTDGVHPSLSITPMAKARSPGKNGSALRQDTLNLSGRGAGMLLGELEHALMQASWTIAAPATARDLHLRVARTRPIEQITAVTVLNRLVATKRLMQRDKIDGVFHYRATLSREQFLLQASRHVAERVMALGADAMTSSIVDVLAERDPEQLAELGRLVRRKLRERDNR